MIRATYTFLKRLSAGVLLAGADIAAIMLCFALSYYIRAVVLVDIIPLFSHMRHTFELYAAMWPVLSLWLLLFAYEGLYPSIGMSYWEETSGVLKANLIAFIIVILLSFVTRTSVQYSRPVILIAFLLSILALPIMRAVMRAFLRKAGLWSKEVVLIGSEKLVREVVCNLKKHPDFGLAPAGIFLDKPEGHSEIGGIRVLGAIQDLPSPTRSDEVIVAMPELSGAALVEIVEQATRIAPVVHVVPDLYGLISLGVQTHDLDGLLLLEMEDRLARKRNRAMKRVFDGMSSLAAMLMLAPIFLIVIVLIKIDSKGPAFFGHNRIGRGGRQFTCFKFRTMVVNAQEVLEDMLAHDARARAEWDKDFKLKHDPRITRIGNFLRRTSLDELPQLFNVLKGEMSLVGPRPIISEEVPKYGDKARYFFKVTPGITGLWQVSGRNDLTYDERVLLDEYYAKNWSLWLDIEIIIRTFGAVFKRQGAY
ncbi:MAG: undecaprenyl-phosphate galactose phosphotransferase WbaP [Syntrophaceae bacterium]